MISSDHGARWLVSKMSSQVVQFSARFKMQARDWQYAGPQFQCGLQHRGDRAPAHVCGRRLSAMFTLEITAAAAFHKLYDQLETNSGSSEFGSLSHHPYCRE
jgi:hypothetical protein